MNLETMNKPTHCKRSWWWRLKVYILFPLLFLCVTALTVLAVYVFRELRGQWQFVDLVNKLEEEQIPTKTKDLVAIHEAATSTNNTDAWLELIAQVKSAEYTQKARGLPHVDKHWTKYEGSDPFDTSAAWPDARASIRFLGRQKSLIERIHELTAKEGLAYLPINFEGEMTEHTNAKAAFGLCQLLVLDAQVAIHLHESQRALNDLISMYRIMEYVDAIPTTAAAWYSRRIRSSAIFIGRKGLEFDLYSDEQLTELRALLSQYCAIGDRWKQHHYDDLGNVIPHFMNPAWPKHPERRYPMRGHDGLFLVNLYTDLAQIPTDDWKQFYEAVQGKMPGVIARFRSWEAPIDLRLSNAILEPMEGLAADFIDDAQLHKQALTGIAIRLYQHEHGSFPTTLAELPAFESNMLAFGDVPFGYARTDTGVVLWGSEVTQYHQELSPTLPTTDDGSKEVDINRCYVWFFEESQPPE